MQCGTPQAPHCLLNSPENYFAVRFSGELFNSFFPPQVNKGCPPQEDGMRYLPTLFRFIFFFSETEVILAMQNHTVERENLITAHV